MSTSRRHFLNGLAAISAASCARQAASRGPSSDYERQAAMFPKDNTGLSERKLYFSCKYRMTRGDSLEERLEIARKVGFDGVDFDDAASVTPEQLQKAVNTTGVFVHNVINHAHWKQRLTSSDQEDRSTAVANVKHCMEVSHAAGGSAVLIVIGKVDDGPRGIELARTEIQTLLPLAAKLGQRILFENVWNGMFYDPNGPRDQSVQPFADYIDSFESPWIGAYFDLGNHARFANIATWIRDLGTRIVKLDIKGYSNEKADKEGVRKGFVDITDGDIDWKSVRKALSDIRFTGWVAAEVGGGDAERLKRVLQQMKHALLG